MAGKRADGADRAAVAPLFWDVQIWNVHTVLSGMFTQYMIIQYLQKRKKQKILPAAEKSEKRRERLICKMRNYAVECMFLLKNDNLVTNDSMDGFALDFL